MAGWRGSTVQVKILLLYHVRLSGGDPPVSLEKTLPILREQMDELAASDLYHNSNQFVVGFNGTPLESIALKTFLPDGCQIIVHGPQANSELPTLHWLREWLVHHEDWYVCYWHLKGARHGDHPLLNAWRRCMGHSVIKHWRRCVTDLDNGCDSVGAHWLTREEFGPMVNTFFWGGNFWWAKASFLKTLPALPSTAETDGDRYLAETWIGTGKRPVVHDYAPHWPGEEVCRQHIDPIPRTINTRYLVSQAGFQPPAKIAVLTGCLDSFIELGRYTVFENKREYCQRHGYHLELFCSIFPQHQDKLSHAGGYTWSRLEHLLGMVQSGKYEWIWTVGGDTLITNFTIKLESIIATSQTPQAETAPLPVCPVFKNSIAPARIINWTAPPGHKTTGKKHLLICGERVTPIQADSFIVKCSPESAAYIRDILNQYSAYKHHPWVENQAMIDLRDKHAAITHIVPQWMMNSYDYSRFYAIGPQYRDNCDCYGHRGQWQQGDFLIHWPCATMQQRLQWLKEYERKIIR